MSTYPNQPQWVVASIEEHARHLVEMADSWNLTLTIEQRPRQPLAMGNYAHVITVRPARIKEQQ